MAVELAVVTPLVIVMLLLVVGFGRVSRARQLVDQAAAAGARAASLTTSPGAASVAAKAAATETLTAAGISCTTPVVAVDTTAFRPGGQVSTRVDCTVDLAATALAGLPGRIVLTSTAASPIEIHRDLTVTGAPTPGAAP